MEAAKHSNIFPVFSQLHSEDPQTATAAPEVFPCERPARKTYPNESGLFLVTPETISECVGSEEENADCPLKVTGDIPTDTIAAIQCLAFLVEFFNAAEIGDLRKCADEIRGRQ